VTSSTAAPDPHEWLEEVTGDDALAWVRERNAEADAAIAATPGFAATQAAVREVLDSDDRIPLVAKAGDWFYNVWRDAAHERGLWRRTTLASYRTDTPEWEVLIDLDELSRTEDEQWVWHGAQVLRTGPLAFRRVLVTLSKGGSDADVTREFDLETRSWVPAEQGGFVRPEGKGGVTWVDENTLLVATDTGPDSVTSSGYARLARRWHRGQALTEAEVVYEAGADDMAVGVGHDTTPGFERSYVYRMVAFYSSQTFLLTGPSGTDDDSGLTHVDVPDSAEPAVWRDRLLVHLRDEWTPRAGGPTYAAGTLLATDLDAHLAGEGAFEPLFTPTASASLAGWTRTRRRLVLVVLDDVAHRVEVLTPPAGGDAALGGTGGWARDELSGLPPYASVGVRPVDAVDDGPDGDLVWLDVSGYLTPPTLALCDLGPSGAPAAPTPVKASPGYFDTSTHEVTQRFATSADGTRVPYFLVAPRDGEGPVATLLYGYGGFEISLTPAYSGSTGRAWLSRGHAYAVANIRGGGEYGPAWHQAALRENRHRAYEDFAAVAEDLAASGLTDADHLGIMGGSNGGLLVGNMLVRYPELFGAVVCTVPLLDMLRYTKLLAGASWMAEYGDPDDPADRPFVEQISAYHRVAEGTTYPAVLLTTSTRDDRVHPGHARKMAARLAEVGADVTYWENVEGGHGGASTNAQAAYKSALEWEFLAARLA